MLLWAHFCPPGPEWVPGAAMKCFACGAAMRLIDVRIEATTPFAIERRIFQCSSCPTDRSAAWGSTAADCQSVYRTSREGSYPLPLGFQADRSAAGGAPGHAGEKLMSREGSCNAAKVRLGLGGREGQHRPQRASSRSKGCSVGEDGGEARSRQMALKERAATVDASGMTRECDHRHQHQALVRTGASQAP